MLNKCAFANSLAVLTAALYVLFAILALVAPRVFQVLFDARFFGANVASLFPKVQPSAASLVTLVLMVRDVLGCGLRVGLAVQSVHEDVLTAGPRERRALRNRTRSRR